VQKVFKFVFIYDFSNDCTDSSTILYFIFLCLCVVLVNKNDAEFNRGIVQKAKSGCSTNTREYRNS
jgi:hypothetical protein